MEVRESYFSLDSVEITPQIKLRIPTVGEVLKNQQGYDNLTSSLTAAPYTYMVQLDEQGIDYTTIDDWQLFQLLFINYVKDIEAKSSAIDGLKIQLKSLGKDSIEYTKIITKINKMQKEITDLGFDLVFKDLELRGFALHKDKKIDEIILYNPNTGGLIDRYIYEQIAAGIRKINLYEKFIGKPANEEAKRYLLEREKKKLKRSRRRNKPYIPHLERKMMALVNLADFPYGYEDCQKLSIYVFNQSFKQVSHILDYKNTMLGIYTGNIDSTKIKDKKRLSFIIND